MRVIHLAPALFGAGGTFGGGERYALELARHAENRAEKLAPLWHRCRKDRSPAKVFEPAAINY